MIVVFKTNTKLQSEKRYIDSEGDWFENEDAYNRWTESIRTGFEKEKIDTILDSSDAGKIFDTHKAGDYDAKEITMLGWGIECIITKKTHPEYFL